jgi:hypothetical protein
LELTSAPVAVKVADICPAATVTLLGTVNLALLLESPTVNPPAGAVPFKETVQELVPGVLTVNGVQFKVLRAMETGKVMLPEPPLDVMELPRALVATTLVS